jgi:hypothetical protein
MLNKKIKDNSREPVQQPVQQVGVGIDTLNKKE